MGKIIVIDANVFPFDNSDDVIIRDFSPIMGVYLNQSSERFADVEDAMALMRQAIIQNGDKCQIYKNGEIPYIEYNDIHSYHHRVPDFIVDSDLGYMIVESGKEGSSM